MIKYIIEKNKKVDKDMLRSRRDTLLIPALSGMRCGLTSCKGKDTEIELRLKKIALPDSAYTPETYTIVINRCCTVFENRIKKKLDTIQA